jgi:eukaryotic-like serine/threonine-protein kinase
VALDPSRITDFKLLGPLGAGASSRVLGAIHKDTGRRVAIKLLEAQEDGQGSERRERFAREAIVLAGLKSRHVGRLLGFGFENGQPFLVLEHLDGETIDSRLKREGPIALAIFLPWVAQMLVGMRDCHALQVVHRDLKPANIFLQTTLAEPVVKLIDFGLARARTGFSSLTSKQHVLGSVGYMSPEQFTNPQNVGPSADIYAMGCVIFRCLSGRLPFMHKALDVVVQMKAEQDPPWLSEMESAPQLQVLDGFVARAIARDPSTRFASAKEMLDAWLRIAPGLERPNYASNGAGAVSDLNRELLEDDDFDSGWGDAPRVPDSSLQGSQPPDSLTHPAYRMRRNEPPSVVPNARPGRLPHWDEEVPTQRNHQVIEQIVARERAIRRRREP